MKQLTMNKISIYLLFIWVLGLTFKMNSQTYNYYFGNIHAHSGYSDGNQDSTTSNMTTPYQDFIYARQSQHIDFYGISDHNHSQAGMTSPLLYHKGLHEADSATTSTFVALYGMEWGVISGGGHVLVYGCDSLMGWEANNYDIYVAKNDYASLWKAINKRNNVLAYLAHPGSSDYNNLTNVFSASADSAVIGMAARSGPATSTNSTYSNPTSSNNITQYNNALKQGYHIGVGLDHDTHNSVFGRQSAGRLVVLANSLSRANILDGLKNMRFYSSDDWNVKVNFTVNSQVMGSVINQTIVPTISVSINDPDGENVSSIAVYSGVPGSGINPTVLTSTTNTNSLTYTHNIPNGASYYYYLKIIQSDGNTIWTSPIWFTRNSVAGVFDIDKNENISLNVFPNPVKIGDKLTIELLDQLNKEVSVEIVNVLGQTVFRNSIIFKNQIESIDTQHFLPGTYLLKIYNSEKFVSRKIIFN